MAAKPLLRLLETPDDIIVDAVIYLTTMIAGTLIVTAYNMAASVLRSFGDGKSPLIAMILAAFINIGLDLLFVLVFHWGVFGAAIASVTAQLFSFLFCLMRIRNIKYVWFEKEDWKFDIRLAKQMLSFALPIALQALGNSVWSMISGFVECGTRIMMAKGIVILLGVETLYYVEPAAWLGALIFISAPYYYYQKKLLS